MRKHLRNYIMAAAALLAANLVSMQYSVIAGHYDHWIAVAASAVSITVAGLFLGHLIRKWRRGDAA